MPPACPPGGLLIGRCSLHILRHVLPCRAGLQLILSAALQLSEYPAAAGSQPAILVLSVSALGIGGAGGGAGAGGPAGGGPRGGRKRALQQALPGLLSIEYKEPLTCVALAGGNSLFASGRHRAWADRDSVLPACRAPMVLCGLEHAPHLRRSSAPPGAPGLASLAALAPCAVQAPHAVCACFPCCAGDGPCVQRLDFDPLWRSYTWAQLPAASYR